MTIGSIRLRPVGRISRIIYSIFSLLFVLSFATAATAQVTAYRQAVAETAARDDALAAFYRERQFEGIWTSKTPEAFARRQALLQAYAEASDHGLPAALYDPQALLAQLAAAQTPAEMGRLDVLLSRQFLEYARDIQTGLVVPGDVDPLIKRVVPVRDRLETLVSFEQSTPSAFLRALPPQSFEYARLIGEKIKLEEHIARGGWGAKVPARALELGDTGDAVIALRNRLIEMGFLERSISAMYDDALAQGVSRFQDAHGLEADGEAGALTLSQINVTMEQRLHSVLVAMERERWNNADGGLGDRHIWVNLTDFTARIVDDGRITFETRSVIGADDPDRQSPEFSDVMEFMVINPSWYVPRSIITKEYLPQLQRNPNALRHMEITNRRGQRISRSAVDFTQFNARNFPFAMRQPPSRSNALGLVKFMFPNRYNIYLHDTPSKNLFARETRAYSHGCIRLNDPFDFAYALLAVQTSDPVGMFQDRLQSGRESRVDLETPVPVHLTYRTAFTDAKGQLQFRRDVYGRDARIWAALVREGVAVSPLQG